MARVLIAGYGDIGGRLGQLLLAQNHEVFGIRRDITQIPPEVTALSADLFDLDITLPQGLEFVFYIVSASSRQDFAYYQAYVQGLNNLIKGLENQPIKRLFFISSTSVFTQQTGEWVTEESVAEGQHFSTKRLLEAEELANTAPFPATVVRFGGIYGPGRTHLIDLVVSGKASCMEDIYSNRIHSDDCAGLLAHLMTTKNPDKLYIGVDDSPSLICEVYDWLAEQLSAEEINHKEPSSQSRQMRSNKRISNAKIKATGYQFKYPSYKEGYAELLD